MLLQISILLAVNVSILTAIHCYQCSTTPKMVCGQQSYCTSTGCYVVASGAEYTANCASNVNVNNMNSGCFNYSTSIQICVCYADFCNTQIAAISFPSISTNPFTADLRFEGSSLTPVFGGVTPSTAPSTSGSFPSTTPRPNPSPSGVTTGVSSITMSSTVTSLAGVTTTISPGATTSRSSNDILVCSAYLFIFFFGILLSL